MRDEQHFNLMNANILEIFGHGFIPDSPYYYIDMELGSFDLEQYLQQKELTNMLPVGRSS
jgi:hypothetical protein